ncbi:hypothetical protein [Agrobacterium larrymoorei]|uniref:hypothetical protein n=1 Tax=Agrobacterium larrymoorei TaxID=160699 RepID=UPI0027D8D14F|nr:hypothetical protein [Agrobacterium larrymoorei]
MLILLFFKGVRIMGLSARDATPAWRLAVSNLWMVRRNVSSSGKFFLHLSTKSHSRRKNDCAKEICGPSRVAKRERCDYIGPVPCAGKKQ